jgi:hypothetical protein
MSKRRIITKTVDVSWGSVAKTAVDRALDMGLYVKVVNNPKLYTYRLRLKGVPWKVYYILGLIEGQKV